MKYLAIGQLIVKKSAKTIRNIRKNKGEDVRYNNTVLHCLSN